MIGRDYTDYVLNDFSIVKKMKFHILESAEHTYKETLVAQINPDQLRFSFARREIKTGSSDTATDGPVFAGVPDGDINMELRYDIYDEYMARSMNDTLPMINIGLGTDGDKTSFKKFIEYVGNPLYYCYFKWGGFEHFGQIKNFSGQFTCFSRWGHPLKATAELTIERQEGPKNNIIRDGIIESSESADTGGMTALLVADTALR